MKTAIPFGRLGMGALAIAAVLPFLTDNYVTDVALTIVTYGILALGLNIVVGYAGLLDLGYAAFFAIGAYTTALMETLLNFNFWETIPFALLFAGISGIIIGWPTLRLRSDYLAIVTLGFGEIVRIIAVNLDITGGPNGIYGINPADVLGHDLTSPKSVYALGLVFLGIVLVLVMAEPPRRRKRGRGRRRADAPGEDAGLCHRRADRRAGRQLVRRALRHHRPHLIYLCPIRHDPDHRRAWRPR
jgi:branched-chain amino acid transport system permease protein